MRYVQGICHGASWLMIISTINSLCNHYFASFSYKNVDAIFNVHRWFRTNRYFFTFYIYINQFLWISLEQHNNNKCTYIRKRF